MNKYQISLTNMRTGEVDKFMVEVKDYEGAGTAIVKFNQLHPEYANKNYSLDYKRIYDKEVK